ncbi:hypothetical protein BHOIPH801_03260 [Bartonella henselae]
MCFYILDNALIYNGNALFYMLNESPEYRKILSFQTCLYCIKKTIPLHVISGAGVWIKTIKDKK